MAEKDIGINLYLRFGRFLGKLVAVPKVALMVELADTLL